ncbi:hypothetical protein GCM10028808_36660 [Spirosoma migulaei]
MKPTIAIIGLGNSGTELAIRLVDGPYRLLLFDQDFVNAQKLTNQLLRSTPLADVEAIDCQVNASWEADIIVLSVPESSLNELCNRIREVATCKIAICLTTFLNDDDSAHLDPVRIHMGEELQQKLPNSKVVNVVIMGEERADAFLISTHQEALATVSTLVQKAGWNPVVVEDWSVNN